MKGCVDMKQVRFVAGMLSAAMLVGIPGTLKVAAADLPAASVDSGVSYATTKSEKVKVTADSLNIRKSADNKSDIVGLLHKGDTCTIVDTKKDSRGVTWGKLEGNKGWINLDFTDAASSFQSYEVKVTAGSLNVRQSANSSSKVVSTLKKGDKVTIVAEQKDANGNTWGQISGKGWIFLKYTQKTSTKTDDNAGSAVSEYTVKVTANSLNIRKSAGKNSATQGTLSKNDKVTIVAEQKDSRGVVWGKLSNGKGWINLNFTTKAGANTSDTFTEYNVKVTADRLNIRKSADKSSAIQGTLKKNDVVTIVAEQKDSRGVVWGKLSNGKGWISLKFTSKTNDAAGSSSFKAYSVKVTADTLNIRKSPNNTSEVVGFLKKGNVFTIVEEKKDSRGVIWGKLENRDGWINLDYTKKA